MHTTAGPEPAPLLAAKSTQAWWKTSRLLTRQTAEPVNEEDTHKCTLRNTHHIITSEIMVSTLPLRVKSYRAGCRGKNTAWAKVVEYWNHNPTP